MFLPYAKNWLKCVLMALIGICAASALYADNIVATYFPATEQAPTPGLSALCVGTSACWIGMENFNSWDGGAFSTNFTSEQYSSGGLTGSISGSYSGGFLKYNADQYGGAGGTGTYPEIFASGGSYTLTLTTTGDVPGVNYFGLWFSALDPGNDLKFYEGNTLLLDFTPALYQKLVGSCPNSSNAFCGNPNSNYLGKDSNEQFAFLNFFDTDGYFDKIVFSETPGAGGGFESDNHTVGYQDPSNPSGTVIGSVPEPGSFVLMLSGMLALMMLGRRFAFKLT